MKHKTGEFIDFLLLKRVLGFTKPYYKQFAFGGISAIILAFLGPIRPVLINYAIDNCILIPDLENLITTTIFLLVLLFSEAIFQFYYIFLSTWLGQHVIQDLRGKIFKHIVSLKLSYFDKTPIGKLVTRAVSDIETIAAIFSDGLMVIIGDLLKLFVVILLMFYTDWRLTCVSLLTLPILLIATAWFKRNIKIAFQEVRNQVSLINTFIQEHIVGMNIVQIFNREKAEYNKFKKINESHLKSHLKSIFYYAIFFPIVEILSASSIGLIVWYGGESILAGNDVSIGELIAFILFIHMMFRPIRQLADRFNVLQMGVVGSERVFKILDTEEKILDNGEKLTLKLEKSISFNNVSFYYKNKEWVLRNIHFTINQGATLALVGETGSGKTTIINILLRFYDIQEGNINIDNIPITDFRLNTLRENIGLVQQDVFLFSDSIINNVSLYDSTITEDKIIQAAKEIGIHDFISSLKGGYYHVVGERGNTISVGERQLIAFLRVYVRDCKILILDEATSTIDSETELLLQNALNRVSTGCTTIIIAHRLSTIKHADKILYLKDGEIQEEGTHEELLNKKRVYFEMFNKQMNFLFN
ncbi:MAG: ABC transporter ATP-binding protein [Bacteroidota bacterium]|nr:ABC transporter ATP-binding protein [Bacteroidota bacterium]